MTRHLSPFRPLKFLGGKFDFYAAKLPANCEYTELERLFGGNSLIQATLEQTCDFSGEDSISKNAEPIFGNKQSLLRHVVQRAKELGTWIEKIEEYVKEMIGNALITSPAASQHACITPLLMPLRSAASWITLSVARAM